MKTEIRALIESNLTDIRQAGLRTSLEELFERPRFSASVSQWRLYNKLSEDPVTSMASLLTNITDNDLELISFKGKNSAYSTSLATLRVKVTSVLVDLRKELPEDGDLVLYHGDQRRYLNFIMGYAGDNDSTVPLKILGFILTKD